MNTKNNTTFVTLKKRKNYSTDTELRIQPRTYKGNKFLDVREYYWKNGEMNPSSKGITIPPAEISNFIEGIQRMAIAFNKSEE